MRSHLARKLITASLVWCLLGVSALAEISFMVRPSHGGLVAQVVCLHTRILFCRYYWGDCSIAATAGPAFRPSAETVPAYSGLGITVLNFKPISGNLHQSGWSGLAWRSGRELVAENLDGTVPIVDQAETGAIAAGIAHVGPPLPYIQVFFRPWHVQVPAGVWLSFWAGFWLVKALKRRADKGRRGFPVR